MMVKNLYSGLMTISESSYSEEERKARSERAKANIAAGKMGGAEFGKLGGRPRKKRSTELVAEKAANEAESIWIKLSSLLDSENEKVVLDTVKHIHAIEEQERKNSVEQEVRYDQLRHAELAELVIGNLFELVRQGQIDLGSFDIEGEVVEEGRVIGTGEED